MKKADTKPTLSVADTDPVKPPRAYKKIVTAIACLVILLGAVIGSYIFGASRVNNDIRTESVLSNSEQKDTNEVEQVHLIVNYGVPFDLAQKVTVALGIPNIAQGVQVDSNNNNRGQEQYLTDKFNDEIGRWTLGYPKGPTTRDNQVSVLAIGDSWLQATQDVDGKFELGADVNTPAQKNAYLAELKKSTEVCVKDKNKGFVLQDGMMGVCYVVTKSKYDEGGVITLKGHGTINQRQIVLLGLIDVPNTNQETINQWISALSKTTISVDSKKLF